MAVLPVSSVDITGGVNFQSQPSLSWNINKETNRIEGTTDGQAAVRQAVEIILHVERFRWQIYRPYSGMEWDGLIGQDPGYVGAELQRRIADAVTVDDRVTGISGYDYTASGGKLRATFTVNTVYGSFQAEQEATLT